MRNTNFVEEKNLYPGQLWEELQRDMALSAKH